MSARVESQQIRGSYVAGPVVVALVVAMAIGALAGSIVTRSIVAGGDGTHAPLVFQARGAPPVGWDAQKLEAMQGRVLAERFRVDAVTETSPATATETSPATAEASSTQPSIEGWDTDKLEAMKGRVLAAQVGAEDPPVRPHLPMHPPKG